MRSHEQDIHAEIARKKLRLAVFGAVDKNELNTRGPELENMYRQQEDVLVPESTERWAQRTNQDPPSVREEFVIGIFEKDIETAEKYKQGVEVKGKKVTLPDIRQKEYIDVINLQNQLNKRS